MARWKRYLEVYAFCSIIPVGAVAAMYGAWKTLMWSYGGKDEFRRLVVNEPLQDNWFDSNPKQVFFREAPLSSVPKHITDKPTGDPTAVGREEWK